MTLYVKFDPDGTPAVIYPTPREGAEAVEGMTVEDMVTMRRRPNGTWVKRPKPPAPTAEEREAERLRKQEERRRQRQEGRRLERDAARRERLFDKLVAVAERIDPDFAKAVADLEAEFSEPTE